MATSGIIQSATTSQAYDIYGARWEFRWMAEAGKLPGITNVSWELWTVGRTDSPTQAYTEIHMTIVDQNENVLLNYETEDSVRSFKGVLQDSGSFEVAHNLDGSASFVVSMSTDIWEGYFRDVTGTGTLDTNMPYFYVYIDDGGKFVKAAPYIDTGTEWKVATAYIDNGTTWDVCT